MGNKLIKPALKNAIRPLKNYNVEERAYKTIGKDKPKAAPPYPNMKKIMEDIKNDPTVIERSKVDPKLAEKLQHVYLTSKGDNAEIKAKDNLPRLREGKTYAPYGLVEPEVIPEGKASLRQIIEFLKVHENDPDTFTASKIAEQYKLNVQQVENVLLYYRPFEVYYPEKIKEKQEGERSNFMKAIKA